MKNIVKKIEKSNDTKNSVTYFDRVFINLKNNKTFALIWILVVSLITLGSIIQNGTLLVNWISSNIYEKTIIYKKIEQLNTKVNISYFIERLGTPTIIKNDRGDKDNATYIFVNKYYFIQTITDNNNNVKSFAVTSRRKDFTPTFQIQSVYQDNFLTSITLNKETFNQFSPTISNIDDGVTSPRCYYEWWPKGFVYIEGDYLGGDGDYQSIFVGINDIGYLGGLKYDSFIENNQESNDCHTVPTNFRSQNTFNTFMLSDDSSASALFRNAMIYRIGVDQYDVNTLK